MKIVFMGTPEFAVPSLEILIKNGFNVVAVITAPDKPSGRGLQINPSPVKIFAGKKNIRVLQPKNLKDDNFIIELNSLGADLFFVVAFRMLPEIIWNMPRLGTYNLHASLLPKYRGAAPINHSIINGDIETGVTTFKLKHEIDSGSILFQEKVSIPPDQTAGELHDVLMKTGAQLVLKSVRTIKEFSALSKPLPFTEQNLSYVSHAPKIFRDDCRIDWTKDAKRIHNFIRGLSPYPGAFMFIKISYSTQKLIKILKSEFIEIENSNYNGLLQTENKERLKIQVNGGIIFLKEIQLEGKRKMKTEEFLKGFRIDTSINIV